MPRSRSFPGYSHHHSSAGLALNAFVKSQTKNDPPDGPGGQALLAREAPLKRELPWEEIYRFLEVISGLGNRQTPPPLVPAKRFFPLTARVLIEPPPGPPVRIHWAPDHCGKESRIPMPTRKIGTGLLI
jgi:hypothetical protein